MKSRFIKALGNDIIFSWRHGFYFVYIALTAGYVLLVKNLPATFAHHVVPMMVFTDPSIVGMMFAGTMVLLERQQGTLDYLIITPLKGSEYIWAKTAALSTVALFAGSLITILCLGVNVSWIPLLLGMLLTSVFHTLLGISLALGAMTLNALVMRAVPFILLSTIPAIAVFNIPYTSVLKVFPGYFGADLIYGSANGIMAGHATLNILFLAVWCALMAFVTAKLFKKSMLGGK